MYHYIIYITHSYDSILSHTVCLKNQDSSGMESIVIFLPSFKWSKHKIILSLDVLVVAPPTPSLGGSCPLLVPPPSLYVAIFSEV